MNNYRNSVPAFYRSKECPLCHNDFYKHSPNQKCCQNCCPEKEDKDDIDLWHEARQFQEDNSGVNFYKGKI